MLGRSPCCDAVARVVARTGFLPTLRPRTPAPWSRPDVVVRVDRCSLSCSAGTVRHPPPPLGSAGRARGNGTEEIMYTTLPNVFSRVFSCARRLITCHGLLGSLVRGERQNQRSPGARNARPPCLRAQEASPARSRRASPCGLRRRRLRRRRIRISASTRVRNLGSASIPCPDQCAAPG